MSKESLNNSRTGVTEHDDPNKHKPAFAQKALRQFARYWAMVAYLTILFSLFVLHESIVLAKHGLDYSYHGFAILNALMLAKVMLVAEDLKFGDSLIGKPLIYGVVYKSLLFSILFILFKIVEEVVVGTLRGQSVAQSIPVFGSGNLNGILSVGTIVWFSLIPFFAFMELRRAIGAKELSALLFTRHGPSQKA
jgi:hypothetical protein